MRVDSYLDVSSATQDRRYSASQVIAGLDGATTARTALTATYRTSTVLPTVYYTALEADGVTVLTSRRTNGIYRIGDLYAYDQRVVDVTGFLAVWDEGDVSDFADEYLDVPK